MSVIDILQQSALLYFDLDDVPIDIRDSGLNAVVDETLVPRGIERRRTPTAAVLETDTVNNETFRGVTARRHRYEISDHPLTD